MPIDVHAHYLPAKLLDIAEREGARYGVGVTVHEPTCQKCLRFEYGLQVRPFFPKLIEPLAARLDGMQRMGVERQILSAWTDIFAYARVRRLVSATASASGTKPTPKPVMN